MRGFDFSPLYRSTVGFDQLQSLLDSVTQDTAPTYPPYNIERTSENDYRITVACRDGKIFTIKNGQVPDRSTSLHHG